MEKTFLITAEAGIHARPATNLVAEASKYNCNLTVKMAEREVNLKSIMGVMSLGVNNGAFITICADGEDAEKAILGITQKIYEMHLGKEY